MASTARTHDDLLAIARAVSAASPRSSRQRAASDRAVRVEPAETAEHRYERKFRIDHVPVAAVEWWLRRHPAVFRPLHKVRWINNIYFDTLDLRSVWENLNGCADRTKTRVRWYGDLLGRIDAPVLERKMRHGLVGGKQMFVLPPFTLDPMPDLQVVRDAIAQADLSPLVRMDIPGMRPMLVNRYRRRYYQSADRRFRATLDSDLEFYPAPNMAATMLRRFALPGTIVLEMKYSPRDERQAIAIGDHLPVRAARNSKYVVGMQLCYPLPDVHE